jgi:hypothetical protein
VRGGGGGGGGDGLDTINHNVLKCRAAFNTSGSLIKNLSYTIHTLAQGLLGAHLGSPGLTSLLSIILNDVNWVFSSSLFSGNMNKIKSRMEQAKYYKKYYGQRKTRIGYENLA